MRCKNASENIEHHVHCTYMCILYQVIRCVDDPIAVAQMTELHIPLPKSNVVPLVAHYGVLNASVLSFPYKQVRSSVLRL